MSVIRASSKKGLLEILSQQKNNDIVEVDISNFSEPWYRKYGNKYYASVADQSCEIVKQGLDEWANATQTDQTTQQNIADVYYHDGNLAASVTEIFAYPLKEAGYNTVRFHKLPRDDTIVCEKVKKSVNSGNPVLVVCGDEDEIDRAVEMLGNCVNESSPPIFAVAPYSKRLGKALKYRGMGMAGGVLLAPVVEYVLYSGRLIPNPIPNPDHYGLIASIITTFPIVLGAVLSPIYISLTEYIMSRIGKVYYLARRVNGN